MSSQTKRLTAIKKNAADAQPKAKNAASRVISREYPELFVHMATAEYLNIKWRKSQKFVCGNLVCLNSISGPIYQRFVKRVNLSAKDQQLLFHLTPARLARRLRDKTAFTRTESDCIYRVAEVYRLATELFGTDQKALLWMAQEKPLLGGKRPKDLLASSAGIDAVKDELMRIAYGVCS